MALSRLFWFAFVLSLSACARAQSGCTTAQLENDVQLTALVQDVFTRGDASTPPAIIIHAQQIVSLAAAQDRDQWRQASQVISYFCDGSLPPLSPLGGSCSSNFTSQFDWDCDVANSTWVPATFFTSVLGGTNFFDPADALLTTLRREDCSFSLDPSLGPTLNLTVDNVTHCAACSAACTGLDRCTGPGAADCCNFYQLGVCTASCPVNTAPGGPAGTDCILEQPTITVSGDPHFSVLLPTGQLLCYSVHGEKDFSFNLITNDFMVMNARFIPDPTREEVTWIGSLGVVVRAATYGDSNVTKIRFEAGERKVYVGDKATLVADRVERLSIGDGRLVISESSGRKGARRKQHKVFVDLTDYGLSFSVQFVKFHLGLMWRRVYQQPRNSHGLIGQFLRAGTEIDEARKILLLPTLDPIPVMRRKVWQFLEREVPDDQLCWVAMNPGYQGKRLIEGHYLDYLVDDVLSGNFKFEGKIDVDST